MWPFTNPMIPYFENAKRVAANLAPYGEKGTYTTDMFCEDFPQFYKKTTDDTGAAVYTSFVPLSMLEQIVDLANDSVLPSKWATMWRLAAGLFVAHWSALYLAAYADGSPSAQAAAGGATQTGVVASASLGDTSITYDNSAVTAGTEKWGTWNATKYGAQLVTMARLVGMGGMYAI